MALHAADLLTPRGRLNGAALWPGVSVDAIEEKLEAFLGEGYGKAEDVVAAEQDEAARIWSYYRAWDEVYQRLLALPSTVATSDQGSASYLQLQLTEFGRLADEALAEFWEMVPDEEGAAVAPITRMSANVPTTFRF